MIVERIRILREDDYMNRNRLNDYTPNHSSHRYPRTVNSIRLYAVEKRGQKGGRNLRYRAREREK